jgi:hypothetical protein
VSDYVATHARTDEVGSVSVPPLLSVIEQSEDDTPSFFSVNAFLSSGRKKRVLALGETNPKKSKPYNTIRLEE